MEEYKEKMAILFKKWEIDALEKSEGQRDNKKNYFAGKAQAFSQCWEYVVFDGKSVPGGGVHPEEYNQKNTEYGRKVNER